MEINIGNKFFKILRKLEILIAVIFVDFMYIYSILNEFTTKSLKQIFLLLVNNNNNVLVFFQTKFFSKINTHEVIQIIRIFETNTPEIFSNGSICKN